MTYVFRCATCKHQFEVRATVSEYESEGAPSCPQCGRAEARRVFTPVHVMSGGGSGARSDPGGCCGGGTCGCRN